jgi:hypothetical protein
MSLANPWRQRPAAPASAQIDDQKVRREIDALRAFVESRAQAQESALRALLTENATRTAEALEGRIQLAAREAIAYAADGLERQEATMALRAQAQETLLRAMLAQSATDAAEALEGRIQLATREAIAYAAGGLERQEATLRALARRVAELHRETPAPESPLTAPASTGEYWIGAGLPEAVGYRRLDIREEAYLADLANLPILAGGASRLVAANVVEFLSAAALCETILPHWRSRLALGGELVVITLDGPAWAADLAKCDFANLRRKIGADGIGRPPSHLLDAAGLVEVLRAAGLEPGEPRHEPPFALKIAARAPAT